MNHTVTSLRYLRIAQISLLTYYIYLAVHDNIFEAIPLLLISGILDLVYPPDYANQSFWFPYKKKTIFLKSNNLFLERALEILTTIVLGIFLSLVFKGTTCDCWFPSTQQLNYFSIAHYFIHLSIKMDLLNE